MADPKNVKIALITGYLGAGKTTVLNRILANTEGIKAAVIVNDIGEINVDASLIKEGGFANGDEVIPLTNGCLCCTLSNDLNLQLGDIADSGDFDYIFIEASGICEPIPITYTITAFCNQSQKSDRHAHLELDNIVAVVDCARMYDEFNGGKALLSDELEEDDLENLLIQQIEFCTTLILNKSDLVTPEQMNELKAIIRGLQRDATIVEAVRGEVPMSELVSTDRFDFDKAYRSAVWMDAMEHPEEHDDPEVLEYEISTFVYDRRQPFDIDRFNDFVSSWPESIIRVKGKAWLSCDYDMSYVFEQAGKQVQLYENGLFYDSFPEEEKQQMLLEHPELLEDWDSEYGDRVIKLCFIGRHMDKKEIIRELDACLTAYPSEG